MKKLNSIAAYKQARIKTKQSNQIFGGQTTECCEAEGTEGGRCGDVKEQLYNDDGSYYGTNTYEKCCEA